MSRETTRFCPNCGAANPSAARACRDCRRLLPPAGTGPLGGSPATAQSSGERERAWSTGDRSARETTPSPGYGGRFEPPTYVIRQQPFDQPGDASSPPTEPLGAPPPARRGGSRGGCVMGLIAFGVICVLTAILAGLAVGRPLLEEAVGEELERAVATELVRELDASVNAGGVAPGTYVIRADEINAELAANPDRYEPIANPRVTIDPDGLEIRFEVYGLESGYRGMVEAARGRIVLTDVEADGAAAQILSPGEVREIVEGELNGYFVRNNLAVARVELAEGALTVVTAEAGVPLTGGAGDEAAPTATRRGLFTPLRTPTPADDEA